MNFFNEISLDSFQAEAFARGLFAVARSDGMHEREAALVAALWAETGGSAGALSDLERREQITAEELGVALPAPEARRLFIKTALLLAHADGKISDAERDIIHKYAGHLELTEALPQLQTEVKEFLLGHLSHVQNVEAVAEVAKKLAL